MSDTESFVLNRSVKEKGIVMTVFGRWTLIATPMFHGADMFWELYHGSREKRVAFGSIDYAPVTRVAAEDLLVPLVPLLYQNYPRWLARSGISQDLRLVTTSRLQ